MSFYHKDDIYLGDSVYLSKEEGTIILYTYNGMGKPSNTITIEPKVYDALIRNTPAMASLQRNR